MTKTIVAGFFSVMWVMMLTGCNEPVSYDYLMLHPKKIAELQQHCQDLPTEQASADQTCALVDKASRDFNVLKDARMENPEAFGKLILGEQTQLGIDRANLAKAGAKAYPENSTLADAKAVHQAEEVYEKHLQHVRVLLAVVAATSSE